MAEDVAYRKLRRADVARVASLERALFGPGAWSRAMLQEELAAPGRAYVAAVGGGDVVGYAGIALGSDAEIMTIGVDEPWRRRGIGAALLGAMLDAARAAGCRRVFLEVRTDSEGPRRLYERAGFRGVAIRRGYYQPEDVDALVMRLDLGPPAGRSARREHDEPRAGDEPGAGSGPTAAGEGAR